MQANPHTEHLLELLEGLNEPQREAVTHGDGPLLILAGAGSGKTRVLTHRIAYLIFTDQAQPSEILAITFTNKAAQEMRGRVEGLLGHRTSGMWLLTFHAACARILRSSAERLGYTRQFTIYDQSDSRRLVKRCLTELSIDPKRFTPAAIHNQISDAKNRLRRVEDYRQMVGSYYEQATAEVYDLYQRELMRSNAMDFDDLLLGVVNLLEMFPEVRERYASSFSHVLVDEYQDTNHAQYRMLQLLVGGGRDQPAIGEAAHSTGHRNLAVVGDDAQCLVAGTLVTMADGAQRPIEDVQVGEVVLAAYGSGDFRPARVLGRHEGRSTKGIAVTTAAGKRLVSTADHTHFAGFVLGRTPQLHMTYVMWKRGVGFRVGTSRTYTAGQVKPVVWVRLRMRTEGADVGWVVSVHRSDAEARVAEAVLAARYGLPTLPFNARPSGANCGDSLVGNQQLIDRVFTALNTEEGGRRLLEDEGLGFESPHFTPSAHTSGRLGSERIRRRMVLTLCGDRHGASSMHRIAMFGYDDHGRQALERLGLSVRPARRESTGWRYETASKDMRALLSTVERVRGELDFQLQMNARLGRNPDGVANSLPFMRASSLRPGMVMVDADGEFDVIETVERVEIDEPVYDLDIEGVHNFIANGLVTHNSIYSFRCADIKNILEFQDDFPEARVVKLEQNYRSTQTILRAANAVITNNRGGMSKRLWSEHGDGEQIRIRELEDEHAEARYVVGEIQRLVEDEDVSTREIAVFYRTNAMSRVLEDALVRADIPYQVIGGAKFYERAEIKDAIAYLSFLSNPQDIVSFNRIANSPRRGLGQTSLSRVASHAHSIDVSIWEAADSPDQIPGLGAAAVKAMRRFMNTMGDLRDVRDSGVPVNELLQTLLAQTGYIEALEAERTFEAQGRIENLEQLIQVAREFDARAEDGENTLDVFLAQIALVADADSRSDEEGLVTLMTLHNAKGLEYPIVFVVGCEDGVFPHSRAMDEGGLEEERRLFYVGVTRAMRQLYLSYARQRAVFGARTFGLRSRFLDEIPRELTDSPERTQTSSRGMVGVSSAGGQNSNGAGLWASLQAAERLISDFHLGQDIVHAAFGDGVVTALEPDGIIVVRFSRDGKERKLMAEHAPVSHR